MRKGCSEGMEAVDKGMSKYYMPSYLCVVADHLFLVGLEVTCYLGGHVRDLTVPVVYCLLPILREGRE